MEWAVVVSGCRQGLHKDASSRTPPCRHREILESRFPVVMQADILPAGGRQHVVIRELLRMVRTAVLVELQLNWCHSDVRPEVDVG